MPGVATPAGCRVKSQTHAIMKPRTKEQKEVWALYNRPGYLRNNRMTPAFIEWVKKSYRIEEAYACAGKAWCSECAREFDLPKGATEVVCPHCGKKLKVVKSRRLHVEKDENYLQEITTCGRWQVIKTYHVRIESHKGYTVGVTYYIHRCYEKWLNEEGKCVVIARPLKCMYTYQRIPWSFSYLVDKETGREKDSWNPEKEVEFAVRNPQNGNYSGWIIRKAYPIAKIQPWVKSLGLTRDPHGFDYGDLIQALPNTPAETYFKQGQYNLASFLMYSSKYTQDEWLTSIKVARRHGFDFEQLPTINDYIDYLRLLGRLGRDTRNPVYLCPANFNEEHQRLLEEDRRREERENRRRNEEERKRRAMSDREAQEAYAQAKANFLNLTFQANGLSFHVLQNVSEFYEIGTKMKICVYSLRYYQKESSLILCATDKDGKRVEIIEVDLKGWRIIQSRAACNKESNRHADIINIVNSNMGLIKKAARACA